MTDNRPSDDARQPARRQRKRAGPPPATPQPARSVADFGNGTPDECNAENYHAENTYQAAKKEATDSTGIGRNTADRADRNDQVRYDGNADLVGTGHDSMGGVAAETPHGKRRRRARRTGMEVTVEIDWVTGPEAADLAYRQWLVIKEVLQWINDHPRPKPGNQQPPHPGPGA